MAVTKAGGHTAPVLFQCDGPNPVQPYHISPWQYESHNVEQGRSEAVLRGDFFCLPFGFAEPELGVPSHGKTAGARWSLVGSSSVAGCHELHIQMKDAVRSAVVDRQLFLRDGENVIYERTTVANLSGAYTMAHHAVLRLPARPSTVLVSTSRQLFGMTVPRLFADLADGEYSSLATGAEFADLAHVPTVFKNPSVTDCSAFPARPGFTDLLQIAVAAESGQPAWTVAVNTEEGYLWFSLRDPALLPATILWMENRGRHQPPWSGRNCSLGLEDVCGFFDFGSAVSSRPNAFSKRGIPTVHQFRNEETFVLPYVQGIVRIPEGFGRVTSVHCGKQEATFTDAVGNVITADMNTDFLFAPA
jgi:hypothetical protein